jgi:hypothetical protein
MVVNSVGVEEQESYGKLSSRSCEVVQGSRYVQVVTYLPSGQQLDFANICTFIAL